MIILGLQGSPRKQGNTDILLSWFLEEAKNIGGSIETIFIAKRDIRPCTECGVCEKEGFCPIEDDMQDIYYLLQEADLVVMATPVFFYGPTAQIKALIDRSQVLWARRYILKLTDPGKKTRKGFLLSLGATKGKNLFDGLSLTAKYFFDAISASFVGSLVYRQVEEKGAIKTRIDAFNDVKRAVKQVVMPFLNKKKLLFLCRENACRSQIASAFAKWYGGDNVEVFSAGSNPTSKINPLAQQVLAEKGIDIYYRRPKSLDYVLSQINPDYIITMGCEDNCPRLSDAKTIEWNIPDPAEKDLEFMRKVRDEIENRVKTLLSNVLLI